MQGGLIHELAEGNLELITTDKLYARWRLYGELIDSMHFFPTSLNNAAAMLGRKKYELPKQLLEKLHSDENQEWDFNELLGNKLKNAEYHYYPVSKCCEAELFLWDNLTDTEVEFNEIELKPAAC